MRRWGIALALALLGAAGSRAQTTDCATAYAVAEVRYVERAFSAVVSSLAPCLDGSRATIPAYRLVALSELRQGQIVQAKLTILRMLTLSPAYRPNRIQDPPTYVALVETVRDEIAAFSQAELEAAVAAQGPWDRLGVRRPQTGPPPRRPLPRVGTQEVSLRPASRLAVSLGVWGGTSSYGGERGINSVAALDEFGNNAGLSGGLGIEVGFAPAAAVFLEAEAGHFPTISTRKGPNPQFDEVESISEFVQFATAGLRLRPWRSGPAAAVAEAGGGLAFGRRDGTTHVGGAVTVGGGLEMTVSHANRLFVSGHATFVGPARALDGAALPSDPLDLFSSIRLGVRTRL